MPHSRPSAGLWALGAAVALLLVLLGGPSLPAQEPAGDRAPETVRVFLDFQTFGQDFDFYRREIPWVDWVRDREDADVHVIITSQDTGGGGDAFTARFIGRDRYEGRADTLSHFTDADATQDERRRGLARTFRLGLVPFVRDTQVAEHLTIGYETGEGEPGAGGEQAAASPEDDPWNFWVFSVRLGGFFRGESSTRSNRVNGNVSANRTTEEWKVRTSFGGSWSEDEFDVGDETIRSDSRNLSSSLTIVKSLGDHWSAGIRGSAASSTFRNQDVAVSAAPAVEWSYFPYEESSQRQLTLQYRVGPNYFDYEERTIFDQTRETRFDQTLTLSLGLRQPWGSVSTSLEGANFLDDFRRNHLSLSGNADFRLFRGFSLDVFGSYSRIRDRIFIAAEGATEEEVLLRRRQLDTQFSYFVNIGFRYTFGSIYNNVVNPRLERSGGGPVFF